MSSTSINEILQAFGRNVQSLRLKRGLTQSELATICDYEKTTISRIENGRSNVTLKTMYILSEALDVSLSELMMLDSEGLMEDHSG